MVLVMRRPAEVRYTSNLAAARDETGELPIPAGEYIYIGLEDAFASPCPKTGLFYRSREANIRSKHVRGYFPLHPAIRILHSYVGVASNTTTVYKGPQRPCSRASLRRTTLVIRIYSAAIHNHHVKGKDGRRRRREDPEGEGRKRELRHDSQLTPVPMHHRRPAADAPAASPG